MKDEVVQRIQAVQRFLAGEKPEAICVSIGRSKSWLYKWLSRYNSDDDSWCNNLSTQPRNIANRTSTEIEEIVKMIRLNLYNQDLFCGAQAIRWELQDLGVSPLPSPRTINRILKRNDLTHRRTGKYEPKGTPYPKLPSLLPNQTHQMDIGRSMLFDRPNPFLWSQRDRYSNCTLWLACLTVQVRTRSSERHLGHLDAPGNPR